MIDENITVVNKTMIIITDTKRYRGVIKVYKKDVTSTDQALIDQNTDQTKSHQRNEQTSMNKNVSYACM